MARKGCLFVLLSGKKKQSKGHPTSSGRKGHGTSQSSLAGFTRHSDGELKESTCEKVVPVTSDASSPSNQEKLNEDDVDGSEILRSQAVMPEAAYEVGDEHDETRDPSDTNLQAASECKGLPVPFDLEVTEKNRNNREEMLADTMIESGHVSDPGVGRSTAFWGSLKRSCSNIESRTTKHPSSPTKFLSCKNDGKGNSFPQSVLSSCSADRVMLKKQSSSQVLPSRSRKLWWKLFLWNLHNPMPTRPIRMVTSARKNSKDNAGYSSDTIQLANSSDKRGGEASARIVHDGTTSQNQWVAFSAETSPFYRVDAWVSTLEDETMDPTEDDEYRDDADANNFPLVSSFEIGETSRKKDSQRGKQLRDEVLQADGIVQSLNSLSAVAHISGMGLKVVPAISSFSSLRAVNLSGNSIVHIMPGALPKSLHALDLSRNKITAIQGLRELTRLRILNLNYNKISRIGHGLSNCVVIKELYLAGNKIGHIEGFHRLLKLTVLDLSFNKITTLGQLVANYHSLLALNLLGNPIQMVGDDQLRKAILGILPHLAYLNKQPIKPHNAREVIIDRIARGNYEGSCRRRGTRRMNPGSGPSIRGKQQASRK